jgi:hypothetical protein
VQTQARRRREERLQAPHRRTAQEPGDPEAGEQRSDRLLGLSRPLRAQRAQLVPTRPPVLVTGIGMPDENDHDLTSAV